VYELVAAASVLVLVAATVTRARKDAVAVRARVYVPVAPVCSAAQDHGAPPADTQTETGRFAQPVTVNVVLVFVPIKYVYPSRTATARGLNLLLAGSWLVIYAVMLLQFPDPNVVVTALSLLYVVYYAVVSVVLTLRR
jgi:hypothetical protein